MNTKAVLVLASALFASEYAMGTLAQTPRGDAHMVVVKNKDVSGQVFKRLGLPNQDYCWEQCVQEARCTGTRWGFVAGTTAGQCQLLSGPLTFGELHTIKTEDGKAIVVVASRKEAAK